MKYQPQIESAFQQLNLSPRKGQVEVVNEILTAFLDEGNRHVFLNSPTGTGKSIIGFVAATCLHAIKNSPYSGASFHITATNTLVDQYDHFFTGRVRGAYTVKGANNYPCNVLSGEEGDINAESCVKDYLKKINDEKSLDTYCSRCEYANSRFRAMTSQYLITNYSYYFIDRMFRRRKLERRTLCVFDEAHLFNDMFADHNAIYFSNARLKSFIKELSEYQEFLYSPYLKNFKKVLTDLEAGALTEDNYKEYLKLLHSTYLGIHESAELMVKNDKISQDTFLTYQKIGKKYHGLGCKIDDLFEYEYPHVYDLVDTPEKQLVEVTVRPLFVGDTFSQLDNADYNLFMSATLSDYILQKSIELEGKTKHILTAPVFAPENKKVVFYKIQKLNYHSLQQKEVLGNLNSAVQEILETHASQGHKGLILAPSFFMAEKISAHLKSLKSQGFDVLEHTRGTKLETLLPRFKASQRPMVLVTPSGYEGLDFPNDLSRFQIICKAPFAGLSDKRSKLIAEEYPEIYRISTLMKVVQGAGRSVRDEEDYASTYFLDEHIRDLWITKHNHWRNQFKVEVV